MIWHGKCMADFTHLLDQLVHDFPEVAFAEGKTFCWSPASRQVLYRADAQGVSAAYSLLHELGHALLDHRRYRLDFELLELEVAAWEKAKTLAGRYQIEIDEDHVQNCLDTYRDWLFRRSICPSCTTKALQLDNQPAYRCFNCNETWRVSPSRFCRPYRKTAGQQPSAVFAATQSAL